jgi:HEAT repeat protein
MRRFVPFIVWVAIAGCGTDRPPTAGGRPASYWVQELHQGDARARKKAALKLGNLGTADPATIPALIDALRDADAAVRAEAALALLRIGPRAQDAVAALSEAAKDRNTAVRAAAQKALEKIQNGP